MTEEFKKLDRELTELYRHHNEVAEQFNNFIDNKSIPLEERFDIFYCHVEHFYPIHRKIQSFNNYPDEQFEDYYRGSIKIMEWVGDELGPKNTDWKALKEELIEKRCYEFMIDW